MRRRRAASRAAGTRKPAGVRSGGRGGGRARALVLAIVALLLGSGTGYLYATQLLFPVPEEETLALEEVPDLRDLPAESAETFLREQGLERGSVDSIHHPEVPEGWVLGQSPLPGQLAVRGGTVDLVVSLGAERRLVPDVMRMRADRALTVLQATGFEVAVDSVEADLPAGDVLATLPEAGTELRLPSRVQLTVSLGPPLVPMPDLAGMQEDLARVVLESVGLEIGEVETRFRFGFNQGEVLEQHPPADSLIAVGSAVRLVVGRRGFFQEP